MKIYEIYDEESELSVGALIYYEKSKKYIVELRECLDEWTAPLTFASFVRRNIFTIPSDISHMWVKERVIPSGRQNIGDILKRHKLKEYDEMKFLEISHGRCSMDRMCIRKLKGLPDYAKKRAERNVIECVITDDCELLCIFANDVIKKVNLNKLTYVDDLEKIIGNRALFETVRVGVGGYSVVFDDTIEIPVAILYKEGKTIPLKINDIISFVRRNLLDTSESCEILQCTRQNLSYVMKEGRIIPVRENVKGNLYMKGDVLRNMW